jgi:hypothetical protein
MARPPEDDPQEDHAMTHRDPDEAALESFFAAARAAEQAPRTALLSAILADAAEVQAARAVPPAPAPGRPRRTARLLAPIGGWRGLAALGACAALGFWLGVAGDLSLDGATLTTAAAAESADDGVDAFFDYASLEQ